MGFCRGIPMCYPQRFSQFFFPMDQPLPMPGSKVHHGSLRRRSGQGEQKITNQSRDWIWFNYKKHRDLTWSNKWDNMGLTIKSGKFTILHMVYVGLKSNTFHLQPSGRPFEKRDEAWWSPYISWGGTSICAYIYICIMTYLSVMFFSIPNCFEDIWWKYSKYSHVWIYIYIYVYIYILCTFLFVPHDIPHWWLTYTLHRSMNSSCQGRHCHAMHAMPGGVEEWRSAHGLLWPADQGEIHPLSSGDSAIMARWNPVAIMALPPFFRWRWRWKWWSSTIWGSTNLLSWTCSGWWKCSVV